jgi:toxin ParE1/3/4
MNKKRIFFSQRTMQAMDDIYAYSAEKWGKKKADAYLEDIYGTIEKITTEHDKGRVRARRAVPFSMVSVGSHFVVYEKFKMGICILTILHQRQDIEAIIEKLGEEFYAEIAVLSKRIK